MEGWGWRGYSVGGKSHSNVILIPPIGGGSINSQVCHERGWLERMGTL